MNKVEYIKNAVLTINDGRIVSLSSDSPSYCEDYSDFYCIPGFIDVHTHLSQFYIRGAHSPDLLTWLDSYTFPEEFRSADEDYARQLAEDFFAALTQNGTTTAVIYTAPFKKACDIAFEEADKKKIRAIMGMTMMDTFSPDFLQQKTMQSFEDSVSLYEKWNNKTDLLEYVFTPRFALTCSAELMKQTAEFASKENAYIQTHLSENRDEISRALELFPQFTSYTEIYEKMGLLGAKTILGHVIHIDDDEIAILKETNSKIAHCPDSNFFLKSGKFSWQRIREAEIDFALGSDVAGGSSVNMMNIMKMAAYRQDEILLSPKELFYSATLGGAKVLGKENLIGSLDPGKAADLVFFRLKGQMISDDPEALLAKLIYTFEDVYVMETIITGNTIYKRNTLP
jgi:guanine deaminase